MITCAGCDNEIKDSGYCAPCASRHSWREAVATMKRSEELRRTISKHWGDKPNRDCGDCKQCGQGFYPGDEAVVAATGLVHAECFVEWATTIHRGSDQ